MSLRLLVAAIVLAAASVLGPRAGSAQSPEPGAFAAGQTVEIEYIPGSGRWLPARVLEVVNDGYSYKVSYTPDGGSGTSQTNIHFRRVRAAAVRPAAAAPAPAAAAPARVALPAPGTYGCTSSAYSAASGGYEYTPRGSLELTAGGSYRYRGFEKPRTGRYAPDAAAGTLRFRSGYLNGGEATPLEDRPGRFYLVFPSIPGGRWTCGTR